jgi:hypothetical protein
MSTFSMARLVRNDFDGAVMHTEAMTGWRADDWWHVVYTLVPADPNVSSGRCFVSGFADAGFPDWCREKGFKGWTLMNQMDATMVEPITYAETLDRDKRWQALLERERNAAA